MDQHNPGAFGGLDPSFCRYDTSAIAILPVPYDGTSTWQKGADKGPEAILKASENMELYDIESGTEVYKQGMVTLGPLDGFRDPEEMTERVKEKVRTLIRDNKFVVGIGGEHTISVGCTAAHAEHYSRLSVIQLDAHMDTRDSYDGSRYNHACVMARIREVCPVVQIGIRSMDVSEKRNVHADRTIFAHDLEQNPEMYKPAVESLGSSVYLTVDLDVFDPSLMPSTGTPEPGGLNWYQVNRIIDFIVRSKQVVGFDVCELLPNPANKAPDFLTAKLIYRTLSMIYKYKRTYSK